MQCFGKILVCVGGDIGVGRIPTRVLGVLSITPLVSETKQCDVLGKYWSVLVLGLVPGRILGS